MDSSLPPQSSQLRPWPNQSILAKIFHWVNLLSLFLMITSGLQIYNANPVFGGRAGWHFPPIFLLGGWLAGGRHWHFAAMWVLVINGVVYVTFGIITGRFRRKLLPIRPGDVIADMRAALTFKLAHDDLSRYNAIQRLLYLGVILAGVVIVLSGISIWKPVQFQELTALFGGYDAARYVHFFAMAAIVGFLVVHVALALIVPKSLRAMITGR